MARQRIPDRERPEYWARVRRIADEAPPYTAEQIDVLSRILAPAVREWAAERQQTRPAA